MPSKVQKESSTGFLRRRAWVWEQGVEHCVDQDSVLKNLFLIVLMTYMSNKINPYRSTNTDINNSILLFNTTSSVKKFVLEVLNPNVPKFVIQNAIKKDKIKDAIFIKPHR